MRSRPFRNCTTILLVAGLLLLLSAGRGAAHPHVFIDNHLCFVFDDQGLAGVRVTWIFDEMFGAGFIMDYDRDGDGRFDPAEVRHIKHDAFDHLKNYHYFTRIFIDGHEFTVKYVSGFQALVDQGTLVYSFLIPCHVSAAAKPKEIRVMVYDSEYYTAIDSLPGCALLENATAFKTHITQATNSDISFYFGMVHPEEIVLTFTRKSP